MTDAFATNWECFDVSLEDEVAHIRLNRPEAFNSMIRSFWNEFPQIVDDINLNARARCIVLSAAGKHFSSGMDLAVFGDGDQVWQNQTDDQWINAEQKRSHILWMQDCFSRLDAARMPVIVAVQGACVGGGVDLISACDVRYAVADAFFCIQEINLALTADVGTFPRLCKLMPDGWVRELAYTGRRLPATKAKELGLVNEVFETHEEVVAHALATAREIASKSPLAVRGSKMMINYARDHSVADCLDYISVWQSAMLSGAHMGEAFNAKIEKREPVFPNLAPIHHEL